MRRTIILSAVGAIALTIGLGVSATLASGATTPSNPATSIPMNGTGMDNMMNGTGMDNMMNGTGMDNMMNGTGMDNMMNGTGMDNMMNGTGMDNMMNGTGMDNMMGTGMDAMHSAMHDALSGSVPADVLAACDTAHTSMSSGASSPNSLDDAHAAHHPGTQP